MTEEVEQNGHGQIYGLMTKILAEVEAIGKGRRNQEQNYAFRGIDDVYNMIHPLFAKHGVFMLPRVLSEESAERPTRSGGIMRFAKLTMAYDFYAADGSHVTVETVGEAMDTADKASNKAMSAAHKYGLLQTFCIPTGSTPDADYNTPEEIVGDPRPTTKNSTSTEKCPDCGGQMWDNRATKKGRQPDFKCKDKSCNKAVWFDSAGITEGFGTDAALRDQLFSQAEKMMSGMSVERRKEALGRLVLLSTEDMSKKVAELSEKARQKSGQSVQPDLDIDPVELERQKRIRELREKNKPEEIKDYIVEHFQTEKPLEDLDLAAVTQIHDDIYIPF